MTADWRRTDRKEKTFTMTRTLTARDMLRFQTCERLLGCNQLTPEARYEQAVMAQQCRNFWFTATLHPRAAALFPAPEGARLLARTPTFSDPVIVTDLLSMVEIRELFSREYFFLQVLEYGGQERSVGLDYFGLSERVPQYYILKHERNRSRVIDPGFTFIVSDMQGRYVAHVPRLLAPYQQLEFDWQMEPLGGGLETPFQQVGLRAVRRMRADNPYSYFTSSTDEVIRNYINGNAPETFFLEATLPLANFPAAGQTVQIKTPQMERPLLIMGASTNLEGAQAELVDESKYYIFTVADRPLVRTAGVQLYKAPPLSLWAANTDFRNAGLYNMWPVPHLLERSAQLTIRLTNGLIPNVAGGFEDTMLTRAEQPARITFICRTV